MNQPDPAEIEAIAARAEAATPGPWMGVIKPNGKGPGLIGRTEDRGTGKCIAVLNGTPGGKQRCADTYFIAHARQDIPALLAALATEKERAENAEQVIEAAAHDLTQIPQHDMRERGKHFLNLARDRLANYHKATGPRAENEEGS